MRKRRKWRKQRRRVLLNMKQHYFEIWNVFVFRRKGVTRSPGISN